MFLSHAIWLLRTRRLRKKAKDAGMTFDEFPETVEWEKKGYQINVKTNVMRLFRRLGRNDRGTQEPGMQEPRTEEPGRKRWV